jgi:hypothetical protein
MWPRYVELLIAAWLAASPWVFGRGAEPAGLPHWLSDVVCAALIAACALLSLTRRWEWPHFAELAVAGWLLGYGFLASSEPLPVLQNDIMAALVLPLFAIIPNEATLPPRVWREFAGAKHS